MKITCQDHDDLNATITLVVEKDDYLQQFKEELKKYKNKVHLKGFRKGKTPLSSIKKMYGKPLLAELINNKIDEKIYDFLKDRNIDILGSPIPSEDQEIVDLDINELGDYTFRFDIGKTPTIDVIGVSNTDSYEQYTIQIDDKLIDEELDMYLRRYGESKDVEDSIEEEDVLILKAFELEGEERKENGWETGFSLSVDRIGDDKLKDEVLSKKANDTIRFDIFNLEIDSTPEYVKKYLLNLDAADGEKQIGNEFEAVIERVTRMVPSEINEKFFRSAFPGEDVNSEVEAREKIRDFLSDFYLDQTKTVLYHKIMDELMEKNAIAIPDEFLKRWLKLRYENETEENLENEYDPFTNSLKWSLIKDSLIKKYNLIVDPEELRTSLKKKLNQYFPYSMRELMDTAPYLEKMLNNSELLAKEHSEIEAQKLFDQITKQVTIIENEISLKDFHSLVIELNENNTN